MRYLILLSLPLIAISISAESSSPIKQAPQPLDPAASGVGLLLKDVKFETLDGKTGRLRDFNDRKATVVAFTGPNCPLSKRFAPILAAIEDTYSKKGVSFLFIDPTFIKNSERDLKELSNGVGFDGPVVLDKDESLTQTFGAKTTTEVFVLDGARTLLYRGAVDDRYGLGYQRDDARQHYLIEVLDAHLSGKNLPYRAMTAPGCELLTNEGKATQTNHTFHNRISRILQQHCMECHRDGGVAPFPLASYQDIRENAGMVRRMVSDDLMPPWFAASEKGKYPSKWANDRSLPPLDKTDLLAWIKAGLPEGDPTDAPIVRQFPEEWSIGKPDVIYELPEEIAIKASGTMPYVNLRVKTNFPEDRWVQAFEVLPTSPEVVHHVIVFSVDTKAKGRSRPELLAAYVPGNTHVTFPEGTARILPAGATLHFQMHYTPTGVATIDRTRLGMRFTKEKPIYKVRNFGVRNRDFKIPPHAENHKLTATKSVNNEIKIRALMPHMHLRGKAFRYEAVLPDGRRETLLEVPRYDFNWQIRYELRNPYELPAGSRVEVSGWFDNSANNPANPNPEATVYWGEQTNNEMLIGYVEYETPVDDSTPAPGMFEQLDKNSDGFLSKEELPRPILFGLLDHNKDGQVTKSEAINKIQEIRQRPSLRRKE